jgi:sugar phosphate isomerase/epimerase
MKFCFLPLIALVLAAVPQAGAQSATTTKRDDTAAEKLGWHLATKAYTFRNITLFETIDISKDLGVKFFEVNPAQVISKEIPDKVDEKLSPELRNTIKKKFADSGIQPVNFGVAQLGKTEASARKLFTLCKDLGIQTIVAEPDPELLKSEGGAPALLDKLCQEYQINVAIHNHPEPNRYATPEKLLEAIAGRDKRIGSCSDVGHWTRTGLNAVECLHKLQGRIITLHFKDVDNKKKDVPWGTGTTDVRGMLDELHRQKFQGYFSMEYETGKETTLDDLIGQLRQSITYFDNESKRIAGGH